MVVGEDGNSTARLCVDSGDGDRGGEHGLRSNGGMAECKRTQLQGELCEVLVFLHTSLKDIQCFSLS